MSAVFLATFIPFLPDGAERIVTRVFLYQSWAGRYGFSLFLPVGVSAALFYGAMLTLPLLAQRWRLDERDTLILQTLGFFTFVHGASMHVFTLLMVALALRPTRAYGLLTLAVLLSVTVLAPFPVIGMFPVWMLSLLLFARFLHQFSR